MIIPPGHTLASGYVPTLEIVFECDHILSVEAVKEKITQFTGCRQATAMPLPVGSWKDGRFHLWDGHHRYIAALMLNRETMLVAWTEPAP